MSKIYFYAVDPGAVSIMLPVWGSAKSKGMDINWAAEGFAANYLDKAGIGFKNDIYKVISGAEKNTTILFGSQTNFSRTVSLMDAANKKGMRTFFIFDHWCNYERHFRDGNTKVVPSGCILAIDDLVSSELKRTGVPEEKIKIVGHPAIEETIKLYKKFDLRSQKRQILFLSEPIEKDYGYDKKGNPALGYNEMSCLEFLLKEVLSLGGDMLNHNIAVKLHPREDRVKMDRLVARYAGRLNISIYMNDDPVKLIFESEYIFGMGTILLMHSMAIGKRTASVQINRNEFVRSHANPYLENILVEDGRKLKAFIYEKNIKHDMRIGNDSSNAILGLLSN